jgi:hypothetical protein
MTFCFLMTAVFVMAQDIDAKVKKAVDDMVARLVTPIEVRIAPVTIEGSDTPTEFSRYITRKTEAFAAGHSLYRLVEAVPQARGAARGVGQGRGGVATSADLIGTYSKVGRNVEVTMKLVSTDNNRVLGLATFIVAQADLDTLGLDILPPNAASEAEVREREKVFAPLAPTPSEAANAAAPEAALNIAAWPNSETRTYYDGEFMTITLWADRDCYVRVAHIDSEGKTQPIYPNDYDRDNRLSANTELVIPKSSGFHMQPPYGRETILVEASLSQFTNNSSWMKRSGNRGLGVLKAQIAEDMSAAKSQIVSTRFDYTMLSPSTGTEVFTYKKPDNMSEVVQSLRLEISGLGGQFTGTEQAGSFTSSTLSGSYRTQGSNIVFTVSEQRNKTTQPSTRSAVSSGYNFSFNKPGDISGAVRTVKSGITNKGGVFSGDEVAGNFEASGIAGLYRIADMVNVTIVNKPAIIPNSLIEKEVKKFFGIK